MMIRLFWTRFSIFSDSSAHNGVSTSLPIVARIACRLGGQGAFFMMMVLMLRIRVVVVIVMMMVMVMVMMLKVEELSPSNLAGTWTSRTCEQWPGPKVATKI